MSNKINWNPFDSVDKNEHKPCLLYTELCTSDGLRLYDIRRQMGHTGFLINYLRDLSTYSIFVNPDYGWVNLYFFGYPDKYYSLVPNRQTMRHYRDETTLERFMTLEAAQAMLHESGKYEFK